MTLPEHPTIPKPDGPVMVCILDGWGVNVEDSFNAVFSADTPCTDKLRAVPGRYRTVKAHGTAVGLPSDADMGNSEVGHNALGSGQVVDQGARLVDIALETGKMYEGPGWKLISEAFPDHTVHFIGLLSDGGVHSRFNQLVGCIRWVLACGCAGGWWWLWTGWAVRLGCAGEGVKRQRQRPTALASPSSAWQARASAACGMQTQLADATPTPCVLSARPGLLACMHAAINCCAAPHTTLSTAKRSPPHHSFPPMPTDRPPIARRGAVERGAKRIRVHVLTDGRDVPDGSSAAFVAQLQEDLAALKPQCDAQIASGGGRMNITMDRYEVGVGWGGWGVDWSVW